MAEIETLARGLDYESQRRRIGAMRRVVAEGRVRYDPDTLLHDDHLQSGQVGRHRRKLNAAQRAVVERMAGDWLAAEGYL